MASSSSAAPLIQGTAAYSWRGNDAAAAANDEISLQLPSIFLSHSGAQKAGFVTHLYHALRHANHRPFFDKDPIDSLPPGLDYPSRVFQACRAAKMGVIVLSEDYVTSLWPMLELQHLFLPCTSPNVRLIYPLFYELRPSDLAIPANLRRWESCWAEKAEKWQSRMLELQAFMSSSGCDIQINLDLSSWSEMLKKLQYRKGEVHFIDANNERTPYQSDHDFIQAIVSNICVSLPPPRKFSLGDSIKGTQRIAKEIAEAFKQEESLGADGARAMGVHGIGGSGKTTLCKMMANFFSDEFCGRCFYIEFPSNNNESQSLLQNIKAILQPPASVGASSTHDVSGLDEAMGLLEAQLRRNKLFLAIDNVWGHLQSELQIGWDCAKRIMQMKFMAGSKILVTSRSRKVLTCLLQSRLAMNLTSRECPLPPSQPCRIVRIPSLMEAEAVEVLKSYSCFSYFVPKDHLQSLARSCFFQGQCHPLYLKLKGSELEIRGRASYNGQKWKETVSSLVSNGGNPGDSSEDAVFRAVEMSLNVLPSHLQDIFINLVSWRGEKFQGLKDLRFHFNDGTEDALFYQVLALEYHGLLEVGLDATYPSILEHLVIHDLHRDAAMKRLKSHPQANSLANHAFTTGNLSGFSSLDLASKKHVDGRRLKVSTLSTLCGSRNVFGSWLGTLGTCSVVRTPAQVQIQVLRVRETLGSAFLYPWQLYSIRSLNFGGGSMEALRVLSLWSISEIREINGWEGVPNLMWLHLGLLKSLRRIEPLGCLTRLETLHLESCDNLEVHAVVGAADVQYNWRSLVKVGDCLPKLQVLEIFRNKHLVEVAGLPDTFPILKRLKLCSCEKLERLVQLEAGSWRSTVNLINPFVNLRHLSIQGCRWHFYWLDVSGLPSLEHLRLGSFEFLQKLTLPPDSLVNLKILEVLKCGNLEEMSGLGAGHGSLCYINIDDCPKLVRLLCMHALPALEFLRWRRNVSSADEAANYITSIFFPPSLLSLSLNSWRLLKQLPASWVAPLTYLRYLSAFTPTPPWLSCSRTTQEIERRLRSIPDLKHLPCLEVQI